MNNKDQSTNNKDCPRQDEKQNERWKQ